LVFNGDNGKIGAVEEFLFVGRYLLLARVNACFFGGYLPLFKLRRALLVFKFAFENKEANSNSAVCRRF